MSTKKKAPRKRSRQRESAKPQPKPAPVAKKLKPGEAGPDGLTDAERAFVASYDKHLGNGTRAWLELHPDCTRKSAAEQASTMLSRNLKVREAVYAGREARWKRMAMTGDQALAIAAAHVSADVSDLFDEKGVLLPPHLWPDDLRLAVDAVDYANNKVKLVSKGPALRVVLEQTGKLKTLPDAIDSLAEAIKQDLLNHQPAPASE